MSLHINDIRSVCVEYFFDKLIGEFIEKHLLTLYYPTFEGSVLPASVMEHLCSILNNFGHIGTGLYKS